MPQNVQDEYWAANPASEQRVPVEADGVGRQPIVQAEEQLAAPVTTAGTSRQGINDFEAFLVLKILDAWILVFFFFSPPAWIFRSVG